ncbi:isoprenoid synthase domain-containing protein [Xylariaceae sp. FL1272]|nr:isoprenoid synthase domain-containing protein [Xylariaceae sp. FL1272]
MYTQKIKIPELEAAWKWPRLVSPHLANIEHKCLEWAASFGAFDPEIQKLVHNEGKLNLLAAMCYARRTEEQVRSGCDLMHLFFMFDEHSDKSGPVETRNQVRIQMDALHNPHKPRPQGEWVGGEFARQFWLRLPENTTPTFRTRFIASYEAYANAVAEQAELRSRAHVPDLETYFPMRRHTSGAPSTIALYEMDLDIPDSIREHPTILELDTLAVDLIVIANDLLSYNKEQAAGDDEHNIITVIMKQYGLGVQQAFHKAGDLCDLKMARFYHLYANLPRWIGPVDLDVQKLVDGMGQCVSGVMHWSYESERYFGKHGNMVKKTRLMRLIPKVVDNGSIMGPVPVDGTQI